MNNIDEIWISMSDLKNLYLKTRRKIQKIVLVISILSLSFILLKPLKFTCSTTLSIELPDQEQDITPVLLSNFVLKKTIENLGWQIHIPQTNPMIKLLNRLKNTFFAELKIPLLQKKDSSFLFQHVKYKDEIPTKLYLRLLNKEEYEVFDSSYQLLGKGKIGLPFSSSNLKFTLTKAADYVDFNTFYPMHISPLEPLIQLTKKKLQSKIYDSFVTVHFIDSNRFHALQILEELPRSYNLFLQGKLRSKLNFQIAILEKELSEKKEIPILKSKTDTSLPQLLQSKKIEKQFLQTPLKIVDSPLLPVLPQSPNIVLNLIAISLLAFLLSYLYYFFKSLYKGFPVSLDTLKRIGAHVCGYFFSPTDALLKNIPKRDLDTLRTLVSLIKNNPPTITTLFLGNNPNYSKTLAELLSLYYKKTIILECPSNLSSSQTTPGLVQFLNNQIETLPIQKESSFDMISAGGTSLFITELLSQKKFKEILEELKTKYDCVLLLSKHPFSSLENTTLLEYTDVAVISIESDSIEQLNPYFSWSRQKQNRYVTFIQSQIRPI